MRNRNDRYLKENLILTIAVFLVLIAIILIFNGCSSKKETIKCIDGSLYNVIPNTSYILIRKGCKDE